MIEVFFYGLTVGGILYLVSIGLSLTFGIMKIVNFSHALVYALGPYILVSYALKGGESYILGSLLGVLFVIPIGYVVERFVIRRLYGVGIDLAIIATYATLLIGVDVIKFIWGATPIPVSDPVGSYLMLFHSRLPLYRVTVVLLAIAVHFFVLFFFRKTMVGRIVVAALEDEDGVRSLGISVGKYFSIVFVLGCCLAALGGVLYAPITAVHPYMGLSILLLSFAVVMVGGMGNLAGTFYASLFMGILMSVAGRIWGPVADTIPFIVMALVIAFRRRKV
jgi:branched-subunit amino acid ABC-type transport system permease component|uniref:Branched-chain amino acid ABC transporter permease n=1 Tax=Candidatus Caldatribacterium californiense TaxID=1454726 RepID=A0A7V3YFX4_9BACT